MRFFMFQFSAMACAFMGGCAAYPLPENATGRTSEDIARIVRCQTRDAIRKEIVDNILFVPGPVYDGKTAAELVAMFDADPDTYHDLTWAHFVKSLRDPFTFYKDVTISYDFTIDSMEMNSSGFDLTLLRQFTRGAEKIGVSAHGDRTRDVKRHFRIFDTFDNLARLRKTQCAIDPQQADLVFPAIGRLKIDSLVSSFLRQNENNNLGGDKDDYATPVMTDTITFTTKFTGNLDPSAQLNPIGNRFVPSNVAVNLDNIRQDQHTIIIVLQKPLTSKSIPHFDEFGRLLAPVPSSAVKDKSSSGAALSASAKAQAAAALDQQKAYNTQDAVIAIGTNLSRL